jgi:hypothetical protein
MTKWGEITWIFFHTLSVKLTEEQYTQSKKTIFNTVVTICKCLPCPDCQAHATAYMSTKRPPETLEDFQKMLWVFHNVVNVNTKKKTFPLAILEKYKTVNLTKAFHFCKISILTQPYNPKMISSQLYTTNTFKQIQMKLMEEKILS